MEENKVQKNNFIKENYMLEIASLLLCIFVLILVCVTKENTDAFDSTIFNYIASFRCNALTVLFKNITEFGNWKVISTIGIILIIALKKKDKIAILIAGGTPVIINSIIKNIIKRPRPSLELSLVEEKSFSFPSGHAISTMVFYGFLIYLVLKKVKNKMLKIALTIILSLLILCIEISRIYLGAHFASDVLAGLCLGICLLLVLIHFYKK